MNELVDLRSDTVTRPTPEMRRAIAEAEVGDDVFGEDPTVNRLEERAAEITGKQASLFVPSGTMGNQIAVKVHTSPGHEIICDERSHVVLYEMGGPAKLSSCVTRTVATEDGFLHWDEIRGRVRPASDHYLGTGLIAIENSHNVAGGRVYPAGVIEKLCDGARTAGVPVHMDGARIFNAATHSGRPVDEVAAPVDSVMFCLSKGLGAPVGSMLAGSREFIDQARLVRKALGGGMRQVGVLAAAGLVALEKSPQDLPTDHANARYLAESLAEMPGIEIDPTTVETNIVIFDVSGTGMSSDEFCSRLKQREVLAIGLDQRRTRMVTHHDVNREGCEKAVAAVSEILH